MDLELTVQTVAISADGKHKISVALERVDIDELLKQIPLSEIVKCYGEADLLNAIGEDTAAEHFDLFKE